jgi:hypothetical protein
LQRESTEWVARQQMLVSSAIRSASLAPRCGIVDQEIPVGAVSRIPGVT